MGYGGAFYDKQEVSTAPSEDDYKSMPLNDEVRQNPAELVRAIGASSEEIVHILVHICLRQKAYLTHQVQWFSRELAIHDTVPDLSGESENSHHDT